jgi:hypothetical protein
MLTSRGRILYYLQFLFHLVIHPCLTFYFSPLGFNSWLYLPSEIKNRISTIVVFPYRIYLPPHKCYFSCINLLCTIIWLALIHWLHICHSPTSCDMVMIILIHWSYTLGFYLVNHVSHTQCDIKMIIIILWSYGLGSIWLIKVHGLLVPSYSLRTSYHFSTPRYYTMGIFLNNIPLRYTLHL